MPPQFLERPPKILEHIFQLLVLVHLLPVPLAHINPPPGHTYVELAEHRHLSLEVL